MQRQEEPGDTVGNTDLVVVDATVLALGPVPHMLAAMRSVVPMPFAFFPHDRGAATFLDALSLDNAVHTACVAHTLDRSFLSHHPALFVVRV
jgi:hypothetical protein